MKWPTLALVAFSIVPRSVGQDVGPTIKVEVASSFIWGEDTPSGAISSTIRDPLTGYSLHRLTYGTIEVTSQVGFEGIGAERTGTLISYTTTIANSTGSPVSARFRGFSIDGRSALPLALVPQGHNSKKKAPRGKPDSVELDKMHCFISGFLSGKKFFSADPSSQSLSVAPQTAQIVSIVVRDPREYGSVLCSVEGCHPTGTIRYALNIDGHDYVFVWPGRSAVYCGS
jgi:hypothetical protein